MSRRRARRLTVAFALALGGCGLSAGAVFAHADFVSSQPAPGQAVERSPRRVVVTFSEAVERAFARLEVVDSGGRRVDDGRPYRPEGRGEQLAVGLKPIRSGILVAKFRVVSDDGHPVKGEITFGVGRTARPGGAYQRISRAARGNLGDQEPQTGGVTNLAFAGTRGVGYVAITLGAGGALFLVFVWWPVARGAGTSADWRRVSKSFERWLSWILIGAVVAGILATALAVVLQGATLAGVSFWSALDPHVLDSLSHTKTVRAWAVRVLAWLLLGGLLLSALSSHSTPRPAAGPAGGDPARGKAPSPRRQLAILAAVLALALTAPLAGHSGTRGPGGLLVWSDTVHVVCMSAWFGGLVMLLVAMAITAGALPARDGPALVSGVVARFSSLVIVAVGFLAATGTVQALVMVGSVNELVNAPYGRLVLMKVALFGALISLGAYNRWRSLPRLQTLPTDGVQPGAMSALRRAVQWEVGLAVLVLSVSSVLVATQPPT